MNVAGEHCVRVRLFDSFEKAGDDGKVKYSYGFRLVFQASDHTLAEEEIQSPLTKVYTALTENGFEVR
jgi:phenylalanyl-tRNA synthetase beta subunit